MPIHPLLLKIRRKKAIVIVPICALVLFIGLALYLCLPMPAGAAVDGFDLSGLPYWKAQVQSVLLSEDMNAWYEELTAGYTAEQQSGIRYVG